MTTAAPPRPRRWLQLHLSTCIVAMLAAGVVIFLNVGLQDPMIEVSMGGCSTGLKPVRFPSEAVPGPDYTKMLTYGWPKYFYLGIYDVEPHGNEWQIVRIQREGFVSDFTEIVYAFSLDIASALAIILASALAAELLARRFARNRQS